MSFVVPTFLPFSNFSKKGENEKLFFHKFPQITNLCRYGILIDVVDWRKIEDASRGQKNVYP